MADMLLSLSPWSGPRSDLRSCPTRRSSDLSARRCWAVTCTSFVSPWTSKRRDRKSTRLNSSHGYSSYAVSCLKTIKQTCPAVTHLSPPRQPYLPSYSYPFLVGPECQTSHVR